MATTARKGLLVLPLAGFLTRVAVGCVLIAASLPKLQHPYDLLAAVYDYALVGPDLGVVIASILPWVELVVGICLVGRVLEHGAWQLTVVLFCIFTFVRASVLFRDIPIECGCCGLDGGDPVDTLDVLWTAALLIVAMVMACSCMRSGVPKKVHGT